MGWKITGLFPAEIKKCIIIVVPHTSWNDFFIGVFTRGILNLEMNFRITSYNVCYTKLLRFNQA